jgi:hypothetical protein
MEHREKRKEKRGKRLRRSEVEKMRRLEGKVVK